MNLLIVRHAQSKGNASGDYSVATHDSLSCQGQQQASSLAVCLRPWAFDQIIVSPLQRAIETITPYLVATNQRAEIWPEIAEACWHEQREEPSDFWNTQPAPLPSATSNLFTYLNNEAIMPTPHESFGDGLRRIYTTAGRIQELASQPNLSVLMVTHGFVILELLNLMLDTRKIVRFAHDNCGMTLLTFDGAWTMEFCNRQIDMIGSNKSDAGDGL